jgi:hypothetical protein
MNAQVTISTSQVVKVSAKTMGQTNKHPLNTTVQSWCNYHVKGIKRYGIPGESLS